MLNKKGYVLTETLVVTTVLIGLFTFIYISIIPLVGKYEDKIQRKNNLDIVYKLYHFRKLIREKDLTFTENIQRISCGDINDERCIPLIKYLELDNYELIYTKNIQDNYDELINQNKILKDLEQKNNEALILIDNDNGLFADLNL